MEKLILLCSAILFSLIVFGDVGSVEASLLFCDRSTRVMALAGFEEDSDYLQTDLDGRWDQELDAYSEHDVQDIQAYAHSSFESMIEDDGDTLNILARWDSDVSVSSSGDAHTQARLYAQFEIVDPSFYYLTYDVIENGTIGLENVLSGEDLFRETGSMGSISGFLQPGYYEFGCIAQLSSTYDYSHESFDIDFAVGVVPIPSAIWLLGSGLIGLVGFRRKLRK